MQVCLHCLRCPAEVLQTPLVQLLLDCGLDSQDRNYAEVAPVLDVFSPAMHKQRGQYNGETETKKTAIVGMPV